DHLVGKGRQPLLVAVGKSIDHVEAASFDMSELSHSTQEAFDEGCAHLASTWCDPGNRGPFRPSLRPRNKRPEHRTGRHRAAEQRYELAPFHSITSSARASSVGGTSRPSAFAVPMLMTSSNVVGCMTARSAGVVPLRI